jgi:uncharacterized protein (DUF1697 family)
MSELKAMCRDAGFTGVETYIASGNVVLESKAAPSRVKATLEARLHAYVGKPVGVIVRTAAEMRAVLKAARVSGQKDEHMRLGEREIFVHFPSGMGRSKLKIAAAKTGTARNMNTVAKLAELASKP